MNAEPVKIDGVSEVEDGGEVFAFITDECFLRVDFTDFAVYERGRAVAGVLGGGWGG